MALPAARCPCPAHLATSFVFPLPCTRTQQPYKQPSRPLRSDATLPVSPQPLGHPSSAQQPHTKQSDGGKKRPSSRSSRAIWPVRVLTPPAQRRPFWSRLANALLSPTTTSWSELRGELLYACKSQHSAVMERFSCSVTLACSPSCMQFGALMKCTWLYVCHVSWR